MLMVALRKREKLDRREWVFVGKSWSMHFSLAKRSVLPVLVGKTHHHARTFLIFFFLFFSFPLVPFTFSFSLLNSSVPTERDNESKYLVSMCVRSQKVVASNSELKFVPLPNYNSPSFLCYVYNLSSRFLRVCMYIYIYACIYIYIFPFSALSVFCRFVFHFFHVLFFSFFILLLFFF